MNCWSGFQMAGTPTVPQPAGTMHTRRDQSKWGEFTSNDLTSGYTEAQRYLQLFGHQDQMMIIGLNSTKAFKARYPAGLLDQGRWGLSRSIATSATSPDSRVVNATLATEAAMPTTSSRLVPPFPPTTITTFHTPSR
ncbi:hypothetical protein CMEL01_13942 [Colletotrichum melonis]|uniref:Uncharacterized protein n=1 Tax=Colletotrichum melonis TaxID=1209925 RepID=A0AAI9XWP1_9PEZI|nr:hypothetical protein CMEL01_13942 [Colletotrichum melonis]